MRGLLAVLLFLVACPAAAQVQICVVTPGGQSCADVPPAQIPGLAELCEDLQVAFSFKTMTNAQCVKRFARMGSIVFKRQGMMQIAERAARDSVNTAVGEFEENWGAGPGVAECGDGEIDAIYDDGGTTPIYVETCDDGNRLPDDGCSSTCQTE